MRDRQEASSWNLSICSSGFEIEFAQRTSPFSRAQTPVSISALFMADSKVVSTALIAVATCGKVHVYSPNVSSSPFACKYRLMAVRFCFYCWSMVRLDASRSVYISQYLSNAVIWQAFIHIYHFWRKWHYAHFFFFLKKEAIYTFFRSKL